MSNNDIVIKMLPDDRKLFSIDCGNLPKKKVAELVLEYIKSYSQTQKHDDT